MLVCVLKDQNNAVLSQKSTVFDVFHSEQSINDVPCDVALVSVVETNIKIA